MGGAEEVAGSLVAAGGNASILLGLVEGLPDEMTGPVQVRVISRGCWRQRLGGMTTPSPACCRSTSHLIQ
jgi:hypothetical protein